MSGRLRVLVCLFLVSLLFLSQPTLHARAGGMCTVDEPAARARLTDGGVSATLPVRNATGVTQRSRIRLDVVAPGGALMGTAERSGDVTPGIAKISCFVPVASAQSGWSRSDAIASRLRYRIAFDDAMAPAIEGVIAFSELIPEAFQLVASTPSVVVPGGVLGISVLAERPIGGQPVRGVALVATLVNDDETLPTVALRATTNREGFARFGFDLPKGWDLGDVDVRIDGRLDTYTDSIEIDPDVDRPEGTVLVSLDKGLYQPGQTVHTRCVAFGGDRRALDDATVTLKITDEGNSTVFKADLRTSRFGVASVDWQLPESASLGSYVVEIEIDDDRISNTFGGAQFAVSRYELPNFTVSVQSDKPYYLPGQSATVDVRADYLFGKPVLRGRTRVVQETRREWDYSAQKWDIEEGETVEGAVEDGRFQARFDFSDEFAGFGEDDDSRYRDLQFAAYVTDDSTGRTEQRRFDVRLTKEDIHVYPIFLNPFVEGAANTFFVSTNLADGTPLSCAVDVFQGSSDDHDVADKIATVRTNRNGLARVDVAPIPAISSSDDREVAFRLVARGADHRTGTSRRSIYPQEAPLRITADRTLLRPGEPLRVTVQSSVEGEPVFLEVIKNAAVIDSTAVTARDGRASVVFPYRPEFRGDMSVGAFVRESEGTYRSLETALCGVLYPARDELKISLRGARDQYQPGDRVHGEVRVQTNDGRSVETVLGVAVVDRAVQERERTNQEFGSGGYGQGYDAYLGATDAVGGVSLRDLRNLDTTRDIPEDMELAAQVLLCDRYAYYSPDLHPYWSISAESLYAFREPIEASVGPIWQAFGGVASMERPQPMTEADFRVAFDALEAKADGPRDPWGCLYRPKFWYDSKYLRVAFVSPGPDKRFDTEDDLHSKERAFAYFAPVGRAIDREIDLYRGRTGEPIRDEATLVSQLELSRMPRSALLDPWGNPYQFSFAVDGPNLVLSVLSSGPDGTFDGPPRRSDNCTVWMTSTPYFAEDQQRIGAALRAYAVQQEFPATLDQFREALALVNLTLEDLVDPLDRPLYPTFDAAKKTVRLWSIGADGHVGGGDDTLVTAFTKEGWLVASYQSNVGIWRYPSPGGAGILRGTVRDSVGAIVPGASVTLTNITTGQEWTRRTSSEGGYFFAELSAGTYELKIVAAGFVKSIVSGITVAVGETAVLDVELTIAGTGESVDVVAGESGVQQTTSYSLATTVDERQIQDLPIKARNFQQLVGLDNNDAQATGTPRLRQYFPETLYWQPSIETDARGRATVDFDLADNITTWRLTVAATTVDGHIGLYDVDLKAFQPFFAEHDPPKVLTEGDRIALPVVLRNYLDAPLDAQVRMDPGDWYAFTGPAEQRVTVPSGDAARAVIAFRTTASVEEGTQRVTAVGDQASDAIEKSVSVHPDGEPRAVVQNRSFTGSCFLNIQAPPNAVGRPKAVLRVYPNVLAQVADSVEGILRRPYGCGEQTISSTYPSVLVLKYASADEVSPLVAKARRYARLGYDRLLGYRSADGGYTYWGHGESDLALTAYALRFLEDASTVISVDADVIESARRYVMSHQTKDGAWPESAHVASSAGDSTAANTAYLASVLSSGDMPEGSPQAKAVAAALDFAAPRVAGSNDPYFLAATALAAVNAKRDDLAGACVDRLAVLAVVEGDSAPWAIQNVTPFNGWGRTGTIETTALVVQALARFNQRAKQDRIDAALGRGISWLLAQKDEYGIWYSTQATIKTLDAMLEVFSAERGEGTGSASEVKVFAGSTLVASAPVDRADRFAGPLVFDVSRFVGRDSSALEVVAPAGRVSANLVVNYYEAWPQRVEDRGPCAEASAGGVKLSVAYDRLAATTEDWITCTVAAGRTERKGYGMLLGEIGLPPGADVDRESLERARQESGWRVCRYDILPDRVVVYLWPYWNESDVTLAFRFRVRYGIEALAAPSSLYDYYNPDARVALSPPMFRVRDLRR